MRFIIHRNLNTKSSWDSYNLGKVMLYALGEKIHLSGISESNYFMIECYVNEAVMFKLQLLIDWAIEEDRQQYIDAMVTLKAYPKIKNKDSKLIINYNLLKKGIENHFEIALKERFNLLNRTFGLKSFKELIDYQRVNFYHTNDYHSIHDNPKITPLLNVLSLQLPEEDGECPILFLSNEDYLGNPMVDIKTVAYSAQEAELLDNSYLTDVFHFPAVIDIPAAMMKSITFEFSKKSKPFKEKLHQWAKICYDHTNTTDGLTFFREQIAPLIEENKKIAFETDVGKELAKSAILEHMGTLQFGELSIDKIWELMLTNENCTEEEYQELLKLKEAQSPKYDGRWPVVLFKRDGIAADENDNKMQNIPQPRKTLDID